jgi:hypothetical protein
MRTACTLPGPWRTCDWADCDSETLRGQLPRTPGLLEQERPRRAGNDHRSRLPGKVRSGRSLERAGTCPGAQPMAAPHRNTAISDRRSGREPCRPNLPTAATRFPIKTGLSRERTGSASSSPLSFCFYFCNCNHQTFADHAQPSSLGLG